MKNYILLCLFMLNFCAFAQNKMVVNGVVRDIKKNPIENVNITQNDNKKNNVITNEKGEFLITLDFEEDRCPITLSHIQFKKRTVNVVANNKYKATVEIFLEDVNNEIDSVEIIGKTNGNKIGNVLLDPKSVQYFPNPTGDIGTIIKTLGGGVQSNNELTGQYSVRGGNYDENLVYINDFEIYRPFLTSSGQQEGLSFTNIDLVDNISFSSGGFESKYGDKMSSVLNIKYKNPNAFKGSVTASLLGVNAHLEGVSKNKKFTYLTGIRYKSNAYLLGSLTKDGEYNPIFFDVQSNFHYKPSIKHDIEILANHSFNRYNFVPVSEETKVGTFTDLLKFSVDFEGAEKSNFDNTMVGLSYKFIPNNNLSLKFMSAFWKMNEAENYNILGYYSLDKIEIDPENDNFGNSKENLGFGTFHNWARNTLDATVTNFAHHGKYNAKKHFLEWGSTLQLEKIEDKLSEWTRIDSAGYSIPNNGNTIDFPYSLKAKNNLQTVRINGYFQDTWNIRDDSTKLNITGGIRYQYWSFNKEFFVSPRLQINYKPNLKRDVSFRFATGMYAQTPFYREIRDFDGVIHNDVKAQQSIHFILGSEYNFKAWGRNFKFVSEAYFKYLYRLNPYEIQDVRIRYFAQNNAKGYATGIDLKLFGEMVKGTDSWITISYLKTKENLSNDKYTPYFNSDNVLISPTINNQTVVDSNVVYPGYIRRPTDQTLFFNLFFQDYLLKNNNFKVHLNLIVGTGLPYGPPDRQRYKDVFKIPPYRRLDIGFSFLMVDGEKQKIKKPAGFWKNFDKIWISAEVFNILGIYNTLNYRWIKDAQNQQWAIPNYLSNRRFNVKLQVDF